MNNKIIFNLCLVYTDFYEFTTFYNFTYTKLIDVYKDILNIGISNLKSLKHDKIYKLLNLPNSISFDGNKNYYKIYLFFNKQLFYLTYGKSFKILNSNFDYMESLENFKNIIFEFKDDYIDNYSNYENFLNSIITFKQNIIKFKKLLLINNTIDDNDIEFINNIIKSPINYDFLKNNLSVFSENFIQLKYKYNL